MLQNTPHEVYVYTGYVSSLYLFEGLCVVAMIPDTPKQDAYYCEFYLNFVGRDTMTIPYFTYCVRTTVAIKLETQKACCRLQLLAL